MTVERFPVEASHILMFARSVARPEPGLRRRRVRQRHRGRRIHRTTDVRPGERPVRPGLRAAPEDRPGVVRLRQERHGGQTERRRQRWQRRGPPRRAALRVPPSADGWRSAHNGRAPGKTWEKEGRRGGKLRSANRSTEYRTQAGELVVTARGVGVRTGEGGGAIMSLKVSELSVGDSREDRDRRRPHPDPDRACTPGASGDYNPLHTDEKFTTEVAGYPSVFAHGMLTMGMTGRVVTDWVGDGRLKSYGVRFSKQVWPGDTLTDHRDGRGDPPRGWHELRRLQGVDPQPGRRRGPYLGTRRPASRVIDGA